METTPHRNEDEISGTPLPTIYIPLPCEIYTRSLAKIPTNPILIAPPKKINKKIVGSGGREKEKFPRAISPLLRLQTPS
jgi:hypothetical protein